MIIADYYFVIELIDFPVRSNLNILLT